MVCLTSAAGAPVSRTQNKKAKKENSTLRISFWQALVSKKIIQSALLSK